MEPLKKDQEIAYYFKGAWKVARTMQVQLDGAWDQTFSVGGTFSVNDQTYGENLVAAASTGSSRLKL